jgi:HD-like signal output (HDOD) protein
MAWAAAMTGTAEGIGPTLRPSVDKTLEESVRDIGIPPRPVILDRIAAEMRKEDPDLRHLASLLSADVSLAAGLLKTANSSFFGLQSRARTVVQALVMLGLDVASRAVAGLILRKIFLATPSMERFWDTSSRIARTSGWLVQRLGVRDGVRADDAYTFGLFRDCGLPILMRRFPDYQGILKVANSEGERPFTAIEEGRYPTNHAIIGCLMAQNWWLPEETCQAIRHHHDAIALLSGNGALPAASARMAALAQLAEHLVQQVTRQGQTREWEKLGSICQRLLGLEATDIEELLHEAPAVATDVIA